jgi:hypothetical protein
MRNPPKKPSGGKPLQTRKVDYLEKIVSLDKMIVKPIYPKSAKWVAATAGIICQIVAVFAVCAKKNGESTASCVN